MHAKQSFTKKRHVHEESQTLDQKLKKNQLRMNASCMVPEPALNALFILLLVKPDCCSEAELEMLTESGERTWLKYYLPR